MTTYRIGSTFNTDSTATFGFMHLKECSLNDIKMDKFGDRPNYLHGVNELIICDSCAVINTRSWMRTRFFTANNFRKYVPAFCRLLPVLLLLPHLTSRSVLMRSVKKRQTFLVTVRTHLVTTGEYMTFRLLKLRSCIFT
jgi:hypothetical protein